MPSRRRVHAKTLAARVDWAEPEEPDPGLNDALEHQLYLMRSGLLVYVEEYRSHLAALGFDPTDPEMYQRALVAARAAQARDVEAAQNRERIRIEGAPHRTHIPIVYYMQMSDLVKIGTSTNITYRVAALNPQRIMSIEIGDAKLEHHRHREFKALRSHGEWFHLDDKLRAHIAETRTRFRDQEGCTVDEWLGRRLPPDRLHSLLGSTPSLSPDGPASAA